ncbi:hypothetical protein [Lapidilactobacillus wuchangensis]|uniref:hypothetical protein n=1 Tax=Lapidilactobacillus wuchangensis TaxID=2486001 RepID=UPI0013DE3F0F|nr:hypothetical protein [Lapidilactobacillus wuchangensis]
MEGVVVSRQICLIALAIRQRLVFETIWSLLVQIDAGSVPQPVSPQWSQNLFCFKQTPFD